MPSEITKRFKEICKQLKIPLDGTKITKSFKIKFIQSYDAGEDVYKIRQKGTQKKNQLDSKKWEEVKKEYAKCAIKKCVYCQSEKEIHVDHIKPKSKFPELAYDLKNLQYLCRKCNFKKSFKY